MVGLRGNFKIKNRGKFNFQRLKSAPGKVLMSGNRVCSLHSSFQRVCIFHFFSCKRNDAESYVTPA
jgi:hypothetical protein